MSPLCAAARLATAGVARKANRVGPYPTSVTTATTATSTWNSTPARPAASSPRSGPRETSHSGATASAAPITTPSSTPAARLPTTAISPGRSTASGPDPNGATATKRNKMPQKTAGITPTRTPNRMPRRTTPCLTITHAPHGRQPDCFVTPELGSLVQFRHATTRNPRSAA